MSLAGEPKGKSELYWATSLENSQIRHLHSAGRVPTAIATLGDLHVCVLLGRPWAGRSAHRAFAPHAVSPRSYKSSTDRLCCQASCCYCWCPSNPELPSQELAVYTTSKPRGKQGSQLCFVQARYSEQLVPSSRTWPLLEGALHVDSVAFPTETNSSQSSSVETSRVGAECPGSPLGLCSHLPLSPRKEGVRLHVGGRAACLMFK